MEVLTKFPVTLEDRIELGDGVVELSASWEEYISLVEDCVYPIEYENQKIIAMSIASDLHEFLVGNIITMLNILLKNERDMGVRGSNRHIFIKDYHADYAPDAHVIKGKPEEYELRKGLTANLNPWLIVEILSPSTEQRDWSVKLPKYKKIPSCRHILYITQDRPFVSLFSRKGNSSIWENEDFDKLEQSFSINGQAMSLQDIYDKIDFKK